jgi:glycerol-3-phosphate dehydrogenase
MARDAVDAVGRALHTALPRCPTADLPLVGAPGCAAVANRVPRLAAEHGVDEAHVRRMLHRYGDELPDVLAPVRTDPALGRPIPGADGYLPVEFRRSVTHEGARTLADVLHRRTHLAIERTDGGLAAAPAVATLLAPLLGWDADRQAREVAAYRSEVERDRAGLTPGHRADPGSVARRAPA